MWTVLVILLIASILGIINTYMMKRQRDHYRKMAELSIKALCKDSTHKTAKLYNAMWNQYDRLAKEDKR